MKKLLAVVVLLVLFVATPVFAGDFEGVWTLTSSDQSVSYAVIHEVFQGLVIAVLDPNMEDWSALSGSFDNKTAHLTTLASRWEKFGMTITFDSFDSASGTITSCTSTPSAECEVGTVGSTFTLQKMM